MSPDFQAMPRHVPLLSLTGSSLASTGTPKRYLSSPPEPLIGIQKVRKHLAPDGALRTMESLARRGLLPGPRACLWDGGAI